MHHKLAQKFGHRWLLSLFFGSSQTHNWLLRYDHFRSCQEASDKLRFALGLHIVYSFITLGLLTAFSSIQTDSIHHLTRLFAPLALGRPFLHTRPAELCIFSQEQETQWSRGFVQTMREPCVNHVQTFHGYMEKGSM